mmetsp:Transcript_34302/g.74439  ORF Transcript_34302/g.74439 Transcript_34302/m.74439 type:complete len:89 (+) Transcript_34302:121-387(+)
MFVSLSATTREEYTQSSPSLHKCVLIRIIKVRRWFTVALLFYVPTGHVPRTILWSRLLFAIIRIASVPIILGWTTLLLPDVGPVLKGP